MELPGRYDPREVEDRLARVWGRDNPWRCNARGRRPRYAIVIPPPNITGRLHHGHALNNTLQDILVRYKRMDGYEACWFPGTDHAGIATQNVVEKELAREGTNRHELGRAAFEARVWAWKERYGSEIVEQLKTLGCSCDWSRLRFTLDEGLSRAVRTAFVHLHREGLIYRGDYMINWCPRCETALSDIEVVHEEIDGHLHHVRYPLEDGGHLTIATTRPETMLGDTGIAVHPGDTRYQYLIGTYALLPVLGRRLPIVGDDAVDPEFGTGVLKVTPGHDPVDAEIGARHGLAVENVLDPDGRITAAGGPFAGMDRYEAREQLLQRLEAEGFLDKVEPYRHGVGHCDRCRTPVEPLISRQWFVRMAPLAGPAVEAVRENAIGFVPERWAKVYMDWLEGIRDWCISRQLWWGHRIPAWYGPDGHVFVAMDEDDATVQARAHYGKAVELRQDEDVLDTWFSSSLWPFSIMGWPDETEDQRVFYPTSVLVTAFDILFFWVARMVMMGLHFKGEVPFRTVILTPLIVDDEGKKMSKSKGNVADPLDIKETHGVDALRFTLAHSASKGQTLRLGTRELDEARNFLNKIWNMARFVLQNTGQQEEGTPEAALAWEDRWILSRLTRTTLKIREELNRYNFHLVAEALYRFTWHELCDWYLELCKPRLQGDDGAARSASQRVLREVLTELLHILHPVMPFITEEIWSHVEGDGPLALRSFPAHRPEWVDAEAERRIEQLQAAITEIRALRAELRVPASARVEVVLSGQDEGGATFVEVFAPALEQMARAASVRFEPAYVPSGRTARGVAGAFNVYLPLGELVDWDAELERLKREIAKVEAEIEALEARLANPAFRSRAPEEVVAKALREVETLARHRERLNRHLEGAS